MLSQDEIVECWKEKSPERRLVIEPFADDWQSPSAESKLQPASYDISVCRALHSKLGEVDLSREDLTLDYGEWAKVQSLERLELPLSLAATVGVTSSWTRRGLIGFCGPQIDPGYKGQFFFSLFNVSSGPIKIRKDDRVATVIFYRLAKNAPPYRGKYQR